MQSAGKPIESLIEALWSAHPELATIRAAATEPVYVVGGAVRDLLLGLGRADLDVLVEGDAAALADRLGAEAVEYERFATAKVEFGGHEVDIASARSESYPHPGSLPVVSPAVSIDADLGRRDFTINAMAIPLAGEPRLIDPHGGRDDLQAGLLRILHRESFADDPTRAIRAARYAARLGLRLEPETEALLQGADLETVSADRRRTELLRLAGEATAPRGFALLREWGLLATREGEGDLVTQVGDLAATVPWVELLAPPDRARALLAAAIGPAGRERELAAARPTRPSDAVELARGHDPVELVLARALGAEWLDEFTTRWSTVALEIDGTDLIAAGVPQGPALGRGPRLTADGRGVRIGKLEARRSRICLVRRMEWREADGLRWLAADLGGARAAFSTRLGGASEAPFDRLNLGVLTDDSIEAVVENRERLAVALGFAPARILIGLQVHGAGLALHAGPQEPSPFSEPGGEIPEVDGHVVTEPGLAPLVFTADCLPVALSGPGGVAMLHCGWRGLAAGIVAAGAEAVGATDAAIGPGIGPCCYEVGPEVLDAFSVLGEGLAASTEGPTSRAGDDMPAQRRLDLAEVARRLLLEAGVERIEASGLCTSCEPELFFSHRRDAGRTGRQGGLAWIEPRGD